MVADIKHQADNDAWLPALGRRGWAWEFLRRNSEYRKSFKEHGRDGADHARWGLLCYEDPVFDARHASVFWGADDCPSVLRLTAVNGAEPAAPVPFELEGIACRVEIHHSRNGDTTDVLFSEDGRFLQLSISGAPELQGASLFMPALDVSENVTVRAASFRRLNDLMQHGHLRKTLYPREPRAPRLINVLKALDGSLEGLPHREIAILVFNKDRVEADWNGRQNHLRDQIRRAIGYGQVLMNGGYRQFLRPTYSRQIARPDVPRV